MHVWTIEPAAPYSLSRTVGSFARFPEESVDVVVPGGYRRAFEIDGAPVLVEARQDDDSDVTATVTLRVLAPDGLSDDAAGNALGQLRRLISMDEPIDGVYALLQSDARLARLLPYLSGLRRTLDPSPFEGLVSSILAQLISIHGAATVRARLVQRFGRSITHEGKEYRVFPGPDAIDGSTVDELCGLKMTSAKARAILAVTDAARRGELSLEQLRRHTDREIIQHLVAFPGVGPWTAEWFLVNVMGRMSVVPAGDLGIRRSTGNWLLDGEMPSPETVRSIYQPYAENRAYVAYYVLSAERYAIAPGRAETSSH